MRKLIFLFITINIFISVHAQNPGDTIFVQGFNYNQTYGINQWSPGIRDTVIGFPSDTTLNFEKILMYYNIRCKGAKVSPAVSGQTDIGCGEWDVSCNTYITDSSRIDSVISFTKSHLISNFSGNAFNYNISPINDYLRYFQKKVLIDSIITDTAITIGTLLSNGISLIPPASLNAKSQYLYTQSELASAGLTAGNIDGLIIPGALVSANEEFLRVKIKSTSATFLSDSIPVLSGFQEVFFHNFNFTTDSNRLQFYSPFYWDGISNIIVEFSFSNANPNTTIQFPIHNTSFTSSLQSANDNTFKFNGVNYIETVGYKGIPGSQARSIEAWIKTTVPGKDIISWGKNTTGNKWIFRVNSTGGLRVEVNGGYVIGQTNVCDGEWHHVAMVMANGASTSTIQFFVDGVLETGNTVSNISINTDTTNGIDVVLSQGFHGRFWDGEIDEIRVWSTALSQSTIQKWMYASIDSTHINSSNLELYYKFNENSGTVVNDFSGYGRNASVNGLSLWERIKGTDLFKDFSDNSTRPTLSFLKGVYNLSISNDTILDTIFTAPYSVKAFQIIDNSGSALSDIVLLAMDTMLWQNRNEYIYDPTSGLVVDSISVQMDGTITISELNYYKRYPMKYEIMSFVTPYGINLDLGPNGKTWTFDLTDFTPVLKGNKRLTVERGGQWMEDMDIKFAFIVGTPSRNVIDIQQLWKVDSKSYSDIMNERAFEQRTVRLNPLGKSFKVRSAITGHGQEGEFIPRNHLINIDGGNPEFSWQVWKTCSDNPIYPQGGTWIYSRSGWCPGAPTNLQEMDITPYVNSASSHSIDYSVQTASGTSNYIVNNQLVTYGAPNFSLDAAIIDITNPTDKVEYARTNAICNQPAVVIQNTGSTVLISLKIKYWVNSSPNPLIFNWTGSLDFLGKETVILPSDSALWSTVNSGGNVLHVEIEAPNSGIDQYHFNNVYSTQFSLPDVVPSNFIIMLYTNSAPDETSYKLYDVAGNVLFHKTGMAAHKLNRDTFNLGVGCYKLEILDSDEDGLSFFANSDGNGYINIRKLDNTIVKVFEPDFGSKITYNFTIDFPLTYDELHHPTNTIIYPNPSNGIFNIDFRAPQKINSIRVYDAMGRLVKTEDIQGTNLTNLKLDLSNQNPGVYIVNILYNNNIQSIKLVLD